MGVAPTRIQLEVINNAEQDPVFISHCYNPAKLIKIIALNV